MRLGAATLTCALLIATTASAEDVRYEVLERTAVFGDTTVGARALPDAGELVDVPPMLTKTEADILELLHREPPMILRLTLDPHPKQRRIEVLEFSRKGGVLTVRTRVIVGTADALYGEERAVLTLETARVEGVRVAHVNDGAYGPGSVLDATVSGRVHADGEALRVESKGWTTRLEVPEDSPTASILRHAVGSDVVLKGRVEILDIGEQRLHVSELLSPQRTRESYLVLPTGDGYCARSLDTTAVGETVGRVELLSRAADRVIEIEGYAFKGYGRLVRLLVEGIVVRPENWAFAKTTAPGGPDTGFLTPTLVVGWDGFLVTEVYDEGRQVLLRRLSPNRPAVGYVPPGELRFGADASAYAEQLGIDTPEEGPRSNSGGLLNGVPE